MNPAAFIRRIGTTADLMRATVTRGAAGGRVAGTPQLVKSDLEVSAQPASAITIEQYQRRGIAVTHRIYVAGDVGAQEGDTLAIGARRLVVRGIRNVAGMGHMWELDCAEVLS